MRLACMEHAGGILLDVRVQVMPRRRLGPHSANADWDGGGSPNLQRLWIRENRLLAHLNRMQEGNWAYVEANFERPSYLTISSDAGLRLLVAFWTPHPLIGADE